MITFLENKPSDFSFFYKIKVQIIFLFHMLIYLITFQLYLVFWVCNYNITIWINIVNFILECMSHIYNIWYSVWKHKLIILNILYKDIHFWTQI